MAGLAGDRDITGTGPIVDFFGYPAQLPNGHVQLALRTGAPLVVGFSRRNPNHTYEATFLPPYHPPETGTEEERVLAGIKFILGEDGRGYPPGPRAMDVITVSIWADNNESLKGEDIS